ncbi:MAG: hypothetical protein QM715_16195 [Nibricoccus sp.]
MPSTTILRRKIIITGTGRTGTTFLVRLLTELGLDTGFTRNSWQKEFDEHCQAGLEHDITDPDSPYIVKNPALCNQLAPLLASGLVEIDHAFIPIRNLDAAALSRVRIGGRDGTVPGDLWLTDDPAKQKAALATVFHDLVQTLVAHEIPFTFLNFPRFVQEPRYAYQQLSPLLSGIKWEVFLAAFKRIANPTLVHDFSRPKAAEANGEIGRQYLLNKQLQRRRRRMRRIAYHIAAIALLAAFFLWYKS